MYTPRNVVLLTSSTTVSKRLVGKIWGTVMAQQDYEQGTEHASLGNPHAQRGGARCVIAKPY